MKTVNVYIHFDKTTESKEMQLKRKAEFFILLAEMKKERVKNAE